MTGVLKGYDQLVNIVLDETVEFLRGTVAIPRRAPLTQHPQQTSIVVRRPV